MNARCFSVPEPKSSHSPLQTVAAVQTATVRTFRLDGRTVSHQKMPWLFQKPFILLRKISSHFPKKQTVRFLREISGKIADNSPILPIFLKN
jgi:hypothetical protein